MVNAGGQSYRGEHLGDLVVSLGKLAPDAHRELHRVHAMGNLVAVELSIRGTFTGPFETTAGVLQLTGAKLDTPGAEVRRDTALVYSAPGEKEEGGNGTHWFRTENGCVSRHGCSAWSCLNEVINVEVPHCAQRDPRDA